MNLARVSSAEYSCYHTKKKGGSGTKTGSRIEVSRGNKACEEMHNLDLGNNGVGNVKWGNHVSGVRDTGTDPIRAQHLKQTPFRPDSM